VAGPLLAGLAIGDPPAPWERLGFAIRDGETVIGTTRLRLGRGDDGICGWTLVGVREGDVDGLDTDWVAFPETPEVGDRSQHPNGALLVDHVVVTTPDLERTLAALAAVGFDLRRTREAGTPERPLRQAFFRMGEVILEVVGPPEPAGEDPARFWGVVVVVADLDACADLLGPDLGPPRDAVQPGRRIATVRPSSGVAVPLALMTPDPRREGGRADD
jgi:hypothetical protein